MQWVVLANDEQKEEFLARGINDAVKIVWINGIHQFNDHNEADVFFDLLFENEEERKNVLKKILPKPVVINSVIHTLNKTGYPFVRINAWPGFLNREIVEVFCLSETNKPFVEKIFSLMNRKTEWTEDIPGFISTRVVTMIINEACFALEEKVSTKEEIDIAMKLGTNYPYGPFEWAKKIGWQNIYGLLSLLSSTGPRYKPASLLIKEALK